MTGYTWAEKRRRKEARERAAQDLRDKFDPMFDPLGFKLPPGRIPANNPGDTRNRIPTAPISKIVKRIMSERNIGVSEMCRMCDVPEGHLLKIRMIRTEYTNFDVADRILSGLDLCDLWYTDLSPVYEFAFHGCRKSDDDDEETWGGQDEATEAQTEDARR